MSDGGLLDASPLLLDSSELHSLCLTIHLLQIHLYMYYTIAYKNPFYLC